VLGFPKVFKWETYLDVINEFYVPIANQYERRNVYIPEMLLNTLAYTIGYAFAGTFVACLTSYLITKFKYKLGKIIYAIILVVMIIPIVGAQPSSLQLVRKLGMYDHIWGLWIMGANFTSIHVLIFCGTMETIPNEMLEAARIDGAKQVSIFFNIIIPLVKTTFMTVLLLIFISAWNDYQIPLLYIPSKPTLSLGVYTLLQSTEKAFGWPPAKIAGCYIIFIPILILFIAFHKQLMGNLTMGGVKE
jgi:ABC-type glycerol-3-phosphate transport system permease component